MTDIEAKGDEAAEQPRTGTSGSAPASTRAARNKPTRSKGSFGRFLREVVAELRKVVRPTRQELITYTSVVIVFVLVIMVLVSALDFGVAKLMGWAFGGGS